MKPILCFFGLHDWHIVGYNSVINPLPVERCKDCGIGRQFNICGAEFRWTKDEMDAICSGLGFD